MKRVTAAQARQQFANLLDAAERGEEVVIERRGVRFGLTAQERPRKPGRRPCLIERMDAAVESGEWTWVGGRGGLRFSRRGRAR